MMMTPIILALLIGLNPIAGCNGYTAYKTDSSIIVKNPRESKITELKFHDENVPKIRLTGKGRLVAFYPATYELSVIDPGNKKVLEFYPDKNWFELESYSAFDAMGDLIAVAYFMHGKIHFVAFKNLKKSIDKIYPSLYPAGLWIRDGKIFLRLYKVNNNTVSEDFVILPENGKKWNISRVIAMDYDGKTLVFATKRKIFLIKNGKMEVQNARGIILDVKLSKGTPQMLVDITQHGAIMIQRGENLVPIIRPMRKFSGCGEQGG